MKRQFDPRRVAATALGAAFAGWVLFVTYLVLRGWAALWAMYV